MIRRRIEPDLIRREIESLVREFPQLADDEELRVTAIEGETDAFELLAVVLDDIRAATSMHEAIESRRSPIMIMKSRSKPGRTAVTRNRPEQAIQKAVFAHLTARPARGVFAFHVPNGGWRSLVEASIMKGLGVRAGVPDIIAVRDGRAYGLELKAPGERLTAVQRDAHAALSEAGAPVEVACGLDDALIVFERWGILRGTAALSNRRLG
jgi:hypothetical protein